MKHSNDKNRLLLVAIASVLSFTEGAIAEVDDVDYDHKHYPAVSCASNLPSFMAAGAFGSVFNTSTDMIRLTCPIIFDKFPSFISVDISVNRAQGSGLMSCFLNIRDDAASPQSFKKDVPGFGKQLVSFTNIDTTLATNAVVGCFVPSKVPAGSSGIDWYEVDEFD